jgi:hypothetical protein
MQEIRHSVVFSQYFTKKPNYYVFFTEQKGRLE